MEPDLKLILDGDADGSNVEILVWSQVMSNASPYFQKLLCPNHFVEGDTLKSQGYLSLPLFETSAQGMQILCDVFHLRTDAIPVGSITSAQLFDVAVLVDKFDCKSQLQPWSEKWLAQDHIISELKGVVQSGYKPSIPALFKWICICQNLDYPAYLVTLTSLLLKHHTARDLVQTDETCVDFLPQHLLEEIGKKRTQLIEACHKITLQFVEMAEQGDTCQRSHVFYANGDAIEPPIGINEKFHCSSITLGNFLLAARVELGSDWRLLSSWVGSIDSTYHQMQAVAKKLTGTSEIAKGGLQRRKKLYTSHEECSLQKRYCEWIEQAMTSINS